MINNYNERVLLEAMLYAMEGKSPSLAIEDQEKREQQKVVRNCRLPKKVNDGIPKECRDKGLPNRGTPEYDRMDWKERNAIVENNKIEWTKQQYDKMEINILGEADDLFYSVELPEGWEIKATGHSMWNDVIDDKGRERISFFYKGAFYDRDAFSNFEHRYDYTIEPFDFYETNASYEERQSKPWSVYLTDGGKRVKLLKEVEFDENTVSWKRHEMLANFAEQYLNEHYPDWEDINAYWD